MALRLYPKMAQKWHCREPGIPAKIPSLTSIRKQQILIDKTTTLFPNEGEGLVCLRPL